jgi:hypothetical protein
MQKTFPRLSFWKVPLLLGLVVTRRQFKVTSIERNAQAAVGMQGNTAAGRELDPWSWAAALIATDIPDLKAKYS